MTTYPPLSLLTETAESAESLEDHTREIVRALSAAGVAAEVARVEHGASFIRYLLELPPGAAPEKVERLVGALSLAVAAQVRYGGQIGSYVALEVPRAERRDVGLREVIAKGTALHLLGVAIGSDVGGQSVTCTLAREPHVLVAGATGQGKSVFLNTLLVSLLMRNTPDELELVLIDPKRVELSAYAGLPHLIAPVVTDVTDATMMLQEQVKEMQRRYSEMERVGVKNLTGWNSRKDTEHWARRVIVIDELADLIMTHKTVEEPIVRIGQLGRAAGIHLVVATQRPSADVVTGLIKTNIPARLAFTVTSGVDARVIGVPGAERLTGRGDALWSPAGAQRPVRVQTPNVTEQEVAAIVDWWSQNWVETAPPIDDPEPPRDLAEPMWQLVEDTMPEMVHAAPARRFLVGARPDPGPTVRDLDAELKAEMIEEMRAERADGAVTRAEYDALLERVKMLEGALALLLEER